jgi:hypothetical protein
MISAGKRNFYYPLPADPKYTPDCRPNAIVSRLLQCKVLPRATERAIRASRKNPKTAGRPSIDPRLRHCPLLVSSLKSDGVVGSPTRPATERCDPDQDPSKQSPDERVVRQHAPTLRRIAGLSPSGGTAQAPSSRKLDREPPGTERCRRKPGWKGCGRQFWTRVAAVPATGSRQRKNRALEPAKGVHYPAVGT